jgi:hypothetical protein
MSAIRTMCPHCMSPVDLDPPEILLLPAPPPELPAPPSEPSGSYAYSCGCCQQVTVAPLSPSAFALLVSAGVDARQRTATPPPAHPLTVDDLIDFHRLLDTHDWFSRLQQLP